MRTKNTRKAYTVEPLSTDPTKKQTFKPKVLLLGGKLQALVYNILPSTTAVFSYAIGSRKLSANEQFFCWCSNSTKFVTNNSNKTRHIIYIHQQSLHQHKPQPFESRRNSFLPGVDASRVYVCASALGCFYSHISTRTFQRALTASLDSCAEIKSAPSMA